VVERISGVPRQVDVYLETPTVPRVVRVGVEVRDKSSLLNLPESLYPAMLEWRSPAPVEFDH